jgi:hypothetical protein
MLYIGLKTTRRPHAAASAVPVASFIVANPATGNSATGNSATGNSATGTRQLLFGKQLHWQQEPALISSIKSH